MREQLSNSEIAKRTGLSRNTVKKWLKAPGDQAPKYKRQSGFTKLSAFEATLVQALKADSHRPKHARRSARSFMRSETERWQKVAKDIGLQPQ
jgi:transposase